MTQALGSNYPVLKALEEAQLPPRFDENSLMRILQELEAHFSGNYSQPDVDIWGEYLMQESPVLIERALRYIVKRNGLDWVPPLGMFKGIVEDIRDNDIKIQRSYEPTDRCPACHGVTWVKTHQSLSGRPCENCLPEAYRRWRDGRYEPLSFQDDSEFTGPIQKYGAVTSPDLRVHATAVDEFRTNQWKDYIANGDGHSTIDEYTKAKISNE